MAQFFYRPDILPVTQPTVSKETQSTDPNHGKSPAGLICSNYRTPR